MTFNGTETIGSVATIPRMHRELFGVFGGREEFRRLQSETNFHRVVTGETVTVGVRDQGLTIAGRSSAFESSDGCCVLWGEIIPSPDVVTSPAEWLYHRTQDVGSAAFDELNGSYIGVVEVDGEAVVVPDLIRSRECFYTDIDGMRVFGTDAASVARCIRDPTVDGVGINQLLYFGVVFENRTILEEVRRIPFDSVLGGDTVEHLGRISYRPRSRNRRQYAEDLAVRLDQAVRRRSGYPGRKGVLSSAGFDSRVPLAMVPNLDVSYTLGTPTTPEVITAERLAKQYAVKHQVLPITDQYLKTTNDIVQYTNGIRESIHIHHRGNVDQIEVETMYHGLLLDTVLRDIYLPTNRIEAFDHALPLPGLVSNPNVLEVMRERLGIYSHDGQLLANHPAYDSTTELEFLEETISTAMEGCLDRSDSVHNAMSMLGLKVTQALPFHTHLADNFLESLIAADADLIDWHLTTPPAYRNARTYQMALELLNGELLRHRPPDRPHRSETINQIEKFLRRRVPFLDSPGTAWPDRDEIYNAADLDHQLFPDTPAIHALPPRVKLRINDALIWLSFATGTEYSPADVLRLD